MQGYEKCFALCQYTTGLIIKEIQKVKLILCRQNTYRSNLSSSQILQDLAPKPPIPKIVHIEDPELAVSRVKSLEEKNVHPPENRLVVQHKEYSKQFSSTHLDPPQPPEPHCEDHLNHVQQLRILPEIDITGVNFVDLFRNLHQQFSENNLITFGIDINFTRPCKSSID